MSLSKILLSTMIALVLVGLAADTAVGCALCGCRRRKRAAMEKLRMMKHEDHGHKEHGHGGNGDVRLDPGTPTVSTAGLMALHRSGVPMSIVDARTGKYDDGTRIPRARWLPADASNRRIRRSLPSRHRLVVTYCSNLKCPASAMLAKKLHTMGYKNVIEYPYGIQGWTEAGYPTRKHEK